MVEVVIYIFCALLSLTGLVITIFSLPGVWLIFISTLIVSTINNFEDISVGMLIGIFVVSLISTGIDNLVIALGAKKLGGTIWGMTGAVIGGIVGLIIGNILGMFLGPVVGATLFELIFASKGIKDSIKAGIGSFIGVLLGIVLKFGINVGIVIFSISKLI